MSLLTRHIAASFDKQLHLMELVAGLDWQIDVTSGVLSFGDRYNWRIQLLGTESEESGTWLWAWANTASGLSSDLLSSARALLILGQLREIAELTQPELSLLNVDVHSLAMIASGLCQANGYYRAPYDGGALFVLIHDETFPTARPLPLARICSVFPQAISSVSIPDHRLALSAYLEYYGLHGKDENGRLVVVQEEQTVLTAEFDEQNRLLELNVTIGDFEKSGLS